EELDEKSLIRSAQRRRSRCSTTSQGSAVLTGRPGAAKRNDKKPPNEANSHSILSSGCQVCKRVYPLLHSLRQQLPRYRDTLCSLSYATHIKGNSVDLSRQVFET